MNFSYFFFNHAIESLTPTYVGLDPGVTGVTEYCPPV